jgi:hypothetical protein
MHISPAFSEQPTPFRHIPFVRCTFTTNVNNLPVNFCWKKFLEFKNRIIDSTSQVAGFSIFAFVSELEGRGNYDTL